MNRQVVRKLLGTVLAEGLEASAPLPCLSGHGGFSPFWVAPVLVPVPVVPVVSSAAFAVTVPARATPASNPAAMNPAGLAYLRALVGFMTRDPFDVGDWVNCCDRGRAVWIS
jgi:hypothetical protein